jgi:Ca2+-binding EF-hand superfamily protein
MININKIILKKDEDKNVYGEKNSNHVKLFDVQAKYCGIAAKKIDRITYYVIVLVDEFEKNKKFNSDLVSQKELDEYRELFDLFDDDKDGLIMPKDFNEQLESKGIAKNMPSILKFAKYFNDPKFKRGVDFDGFVEAIVEFGNLDGEEGIRRIFELYIDDIDQYTITLIGMKRIVKELNSGELQDQIHDLFKYAINKDVDLTYQEFRDHVLRGIHEGRIKIPKKI